MRQTAQACQEMYGCQTTEKPKFKKVLAIWTVNGMMQHISDTSCKIKGQAVKKAKEMALKYGCAFYVETEMQALGLTLFVTPVKGEMGRWKFWSGICN